LSKKKNVVFCSQNVLTKEKLINSIPFYSIEYFSESNLTSRIVIAEKKIFKFVLAA
jgi:hypothetical protein